MPTYIASDLLTKPLPGIDQAAAYFGTISGMAAVPAVSDILRPLKLPGGFRMGALLVNVRTAFGAAGTTAKIGISHTDGSATAAFFTDATTQIAASADATLASAGTKVVMPQAGVFTTVKESFLELVVSAVVTPVAGVADFCAVGEFTGTR